MLGTKEPEFQAIPAGNPEIETRRRGVLRPRVGLETPMSDVIYTEPRADFTWVESVFPGMV
jgi:hypothetical protein